MTPRSRPPAAFTLIEVLVAVAVGMAVMGLAISAYHHSQRLIRRAEALLRLHRTAGDIAERWEKDASALMQHVASNTTTSYTAGIKNLVQFTGMRTLGYHYDNLLYDSPHDTDLAWVRWEWRAADHRLTRAQSPSSHWSPWFDKSFFSYLEWDTKLPHRPVIGMRPTPVRTYAEFAAGTKNWYNALSANPAAVTGTRFFDLLFLTGTDIDNVTRTYNFAPEMDANAAGGTCNSLLAGTMTSASWSTLPVPDQRRTLAEDVSDCAISIINRAGTLQSDTGAGLSLSIDGEEQDAWAGAAAAARPSVLRLTLTLTDRSTGLIQSFTFSAKAP